LNANSNRAHAHVRAFFFDLNLIQKKFKCKTNACNDDDKTLYLFNKHGMLHVADASTVSISSHISPVPENAGCPEYGHPGFFYISF
jgi:hypothetical protein